MSTVRPTIFLLFCDGKDPRDHLIQIWNSEKIDITDW